MAHGQWLGLIPELEMAITFSCALFARNYNPWLNQPWYRSKGYVINSLYTNIVANASTHADFEEHIKVKKIL